jgi:hypothetical protein
MWEPRRLTTLWTFMACYRNSFIFYFTFTRNNNLGSQVIWGSGMIYKSVGQRELSHALFLISCLACSSTLRMKATRSSEKWGIFRTSRRHNVEGAAVITSNPTAILVTSAMASDTKMKKCLYNSIRPILLMWYSNERWRVWYMAQNLYQSYTWTLYPCVRSKRCLSSKIALSLSDWFVGFCGIYYKKEYSSRCETTILAPSDYSFKITWNSIPLQ